MDVGHFVCGTVGGMSSTMIGHPLDTLKVRMQMCKRNGGFLSVFRSTVAWGGYGAFYKGLTAPLAATSLVTAVAFGVKGNAEKVLLERNFGRETAVVGSAFIAGVAIAPISCCFEFAKCQAQTGKFTSPLECAVQTVKTHGVRALLPGFSIVLARDVPSMGLYFTLYDRLKRSQSGILTHETIGPMLSGGIAGTAGMCLIHPIDVIKSRFQLAPYGTSIPHVVKELRKIPRWYALGFSAALPRAFVANAACFYAYEKTRQWTG